MALLLTCAIICAVILVLSIPIYLILLYSQFKFRAKFPFNSTFFKLSFHLGIFDLIHIANSWLIGTLHYMGLYSIILAHANIFAKQFSLVWWFSVWGQKLTVLCLAIDRLACLWFRHVSFTFFLFPCQHTSIIL